jgi:hypothetical protein
MASQILFSMARDAHTLPPTCAAVKRIRSRSINGAGGLRGLPSVQAVEMDLNSRRDRVDRRNRLQEGHGSYRAWS